MDCFYSQMITWIKDLQWEKDRYLILNLNYLQVNLKFQVTGLGG